MTTKPDGITWGQIATVIAIIGGVLTISTFINGLKTEVVVLQHDMRQVKAALKIPDSSESASEAVPTEYIENADGLIPAVLNPKTTWAAAYLADHCKHCPECCPKVAAEAWP